MNIADPIEFVIAALGPKAAAVAGRRGTGLMSFGLLDPAAWQALQTARRKAAADPRTTSYLVTALHVIDRPEDSESEAARDATGHIVMSLLTFAADTAAAFDHLEPHRHPRRSRSRRARHPAGRRSTYRNDPARSTLQLTRTRWSTTLSR